MKRPWRSIAAAAGIAGSVYWSGAAGLPRSLQASADSGQVGGTSTATTRPQEGVTVVEVTAERFSFTPSEIRVKAGTRLQIRLRSEDTDHGFRLPDTEIDVRIPKRNRGTTTVTFEATKPGRYTYQCSHVCGAGHSFMRGEIVVTE